MVLFQILTTFIGQVSASRPASDSKQTIASIDEPICMIVVDGGETRHYYHYDALGSIVALSNIDGEIEEQYSYDVYGEPSSASSIGNPYLFTGRRFDDESDLYYYRARYYSYSLGRFLQADPIGYADSMNLYGYVDNSPINYVDPYGLIIKIFGDEESVKVAYAYLIKSERFRETWEMLDKDEDTKCYIFTNDIEKNKFDLEVAEKTKGGIMVVSWDPHMAVEGFKKKKSTGTQSPALGLAHELEHARGFLEIGHLNTNPTHDDYRTFEERRVIQGPEREIAIELGESIRYSHFGRTFRVDSPTKRCKN